VYTSIFIIDNPCLRVKVRFLYIFLNIILKKELQINIVPHAYKIIGDAYVIPLIDMWASKSEEDYISEIIIPVEI